VAGVAHNPPPPHKTIIPKKNAGGALATGYLDNMKSTFELLKYRTEYYKAVISAMLQSIGVPLEKLLFQTGSEYQLTPEFTLDILKLTTLCSQHDAQKARAHVLPPALCHLWRHITLCSQHDAQKARATPAVCHLWRHTPQGIS
jgi:hypothetical protein